MVVIMMVMMMIAQAQLLGTCSVVGSILITLEFNPHNNSMRQALLLALFYRCGNRCTERIRNLLMISQEMADQEPGILAESNPNSRELPFLCQFTTYRIIKITTTYWVFNKCKVLS